MKETILSLRKEGKSYKEIRDFTGAAISTIRYHCDPHYREAAQKRKAKSRKNLLNKLKELKKGQCYVCGYNRYIGALDFHHLDPATKDRRFKSISDILRASSLDAAIEETKKCVLLCANCHREVHGGLLILK